MAMEADEVMIVDNDGNDVPVRDYAEALAGQPAPRDTREEGAK